MKRFGIVAVVSLLALSGCIQGDERFIKEGLARTPIQANDLRELPTSSEVRADSGEAVSPTDNEMIMFAVDAAESIRRQWEFFSYGQELNPPSFTVGYLLNDRQVQIECADKRMLSGTSSMPVLCDGKLTLPIAGLRNMYAQSARDDERLLYVAIATQLGEFYVRAIQQFARNVFQMEIKAPDANRTQRFAECVAGVLVSSSFDHKGLQLNAGGWDMSSQIAIESGYGSTPALCYTNFWR